MARTATLRTAMFLSVLAAVLRAPLPAAADDARTFEQLKSRFDKEYDAGQHAAAEKTALQLRRLAEGALAGQPELLGTAIQSQAIAVHDQKRFADAEKLYKQCLAVREKALGAEHADVGWTLFLLGWLHEDQRRADDAIACFKRAAAIQEKALGRDDDRLGRTLYRLADLFHDQGRDAEAQPLYKQVLAIYEKAFGAESEKVADVLNDLGWVACDLSHFKESQSAYDRALAIYQKLHGEDDSRVANVLNNLAVLAKAQDQYADAERLYQKSLAVRQKVFGPEHRVVAQTFNNLGVLYSQLGRYAEAEKSHGRALAIREKADPQGLDTAVSLNNLAEVYREQARYKDAEPLYRRSLAIKEKALGTDHIEVAWLHHNLGLLYHGQGRYAESEKALLAALKGEERALGPDHLDVASTHNSLAILYHDQGRYADAEREYKRALAAREKALGAGHTLVAASLHNMATLCKELGRYAEAGPLLERSLAIEQAAFGPNHPRVATSLNSLGNLYFDLGRYAEAERLYRQALSVREKSLGPEHPDTASTVNNLALLYDEQGRYAEAEPLYKKSLAVREKALGADHLEVAASLNNLATLYVTLDRYAEAEPLHKRALAIKEKALGRKHADVAASLNNLGLMYKYQGRFADAEPLFERALAIKEEKLGPDHPDVAAGLFNLALLRDVQGRPADAEPLVDRALRILERSRVDPAFQYRAYRLRAKLGWHAGRRDEALADLRRAMEAAEFQRAHASGAERERAELFGGFSGAFEQMVAWQADVGDLNQALDAIERGRARSLLDEMQVVGADLQVGRPAVERERLRGKEADLKTRIASLETQLNKTADARSAEAARLRGDLAQARDALYQHYRDERGSSPVYRHLLAAGSGTPRLSQFQRAVVQEGGLMLVYLFGREGGYLMVIGPKDARLVKLAVDEAAAKSLGVDAGPLTAQRLRRALVADGKTSLLGQLADPKKAEAAHPKLATLWKVLIPEPERKLLAGGSVKRLIVVPDGPLALLPFETLIVEPGQTPRFMLDVGPPVLYAPSATVVYNLMERPKAAPSAGREPVLTLGNPNYLVPGAEAAPESSGPLEQLAAWSRYGAAGGKLTALPYSGRESSWVTDVFQNAGLRSARLDGAEATEGNLRRQVAGRRIVHLACHGLADQAYGNFYGALALAPGKDATIDPADDGYLTLAEIYELDLKGCELLVLSACQTNYGPQQDGEGVWSLSRGFLVAGSRRVVASNWLVDDEAAASLVSYFCGALAAAEKAGKPLDYAAALHEAKRWVRRQEAWQSPYFWGTFVLVGPQ